MTELETKNQSANGQKFFSCPVENIIVEPGRFRRSFEEIEEFAASIVTLGQLQPIVVAYPEREADKAAGRFRLVAGERRLRAIQFLKMETIDCSLVTDLDEFELRLIELEENLRRKGFKWHEEARSTKKLMELKQAQEGAAKKGIGGGFGIKEAAELLGKSIGTIHFDLELAAVLEKYPDIERCPTKAAAMKEFRKRESLEKKDEPRT